MKKKAEQQAKDKEEYDKMIDQWLKDEGIL